MSETPPDRASTITGRLFLQRRMVYTLSLALICAIGIASRVFYFNSLLLDKYLGDAVYAVAFYLLLGIVSDRMTPGTKAILTLVFVLAIELFQLTLIPLQLSQSDGFLLRLLSIVLGTQFAWWDIVAYLVGIAGVYAVDRVYVDRLSQAMRSS